MEAENQWKNEGSMATKFHAEDTWMSKLNLLSH